MVTAILPLNVIVWPALSGKAEIAVRALWKALIVTFIPTRNRG
jgi:hypothetical protein